MTQIKNKALRSRLDAAGLTDITLHKEKTFFFIQSDKRYWTFSRLNHLSFNCQSVAEWVREIEALIDENKELGEEKQFD